MRSIVVFLLVLLSVLPVEANDQYREHCAQCHHPDRVGGMGPALLPENLERVPKKESAEVIANGRPATQMPPFGDKLSPEEVQALVGYIYAPVTPAPTWSDADIQASRVIWIANEKLPKKPLHNSDLMNLFMVVELGDHHVTVLDGDRFEPIARFPSRFAVHGGIKYSPDGRFAYMASRDGWISRFDLYALKMTHEIRVGINTRNVAVSGDGRYVMAANTLPRSLVVLDARDLSLVKTIPLVNAKGESSRPSAVYSAPPRQSFIVALKDITEVWEIPLADKAGKPVTDFTVRAIELDAVLDDFLFDQAYKRLIGASRKGPNGQVVDLDAAKKIAEVPLTGMPHLASGIIWPYQDTEVLATPNLKEGEVTVVDLKTWQVIKRIPTLGPGFFMRSHENSPYAWVDVFFGKDKDAVHVIDKATLEVVKTIRPAPGKTSAHVEFTKSGGHALLSIWEMDGALVIYDAKSLEEVKRIPMKKPSGKYNVSNKINRSAGTSH
ncbi:MAG: c-type cytochrome [Magnetococcales bacterium]|nr:c-type cytochrome [Magnetococcales bacterium]